MSKVYEFKTQGRRIVTEQQPYLRTTGRNGAPLKRPVQDTQEVTLVKSVAVTLTRKRRANMKKLARKRQRRVHTR